MDVHEQYRQYDCVGLLGIRDGFSCRWYGILLPILIMPEV